MCGLPAFFPAGRRRRAAPDEAAADAEILGIGSSPAGEK
jgi:hypothetical protein